MALSRTVTRRADPLEEVGEPPILDEMYSMMRSGQNRAHSLALEIKRIFRLRERVERELQ